MPAFVGFTGFFGFITLPDIDGPLADAGSAVRAPARVNAPAYSAILRKTGLAMKSSLDKFLNFYQPLKLI
jgi:hypothetical protein